MLQNMFPTECSLIIVHIFFIVRHNTIRIYYRLWLETAADVFQVALCCLFNELNLERFIINQK